MGGGKGSKKLLRGVKITERVVMGLKCEGAAGGGKNLAKLVKGEIGSKCSGKHV